METLDLSLTRADFETPEVLNACNPDFLTGYVHGPIPNNNPGWLPLAVIDRVLQSGRVSLIKASDITDGLARNPPANPLVTLNKENGLVCDIAIYDPIMCGMSFNTQAQLRKHLRNVHPGATANITSRPKSTADISNGINSLKLWVLSGGWRDAIYMYEPGRGPEKSVIGRYCDALERISREDLDFAHKYGTQFHRRPCRSLSASDIEELLGK
ncbi:uncharacterized protein N7482_010518 [Penicillium canariense]|uniref:C2H2-type domain-containing protein n=1 Tax=Penicillium canariense TaxID=189055 RepID=A0A9W9LD10_9EURO|nr:uncharacterized protein N7482_010518 [Penicillium canariense]KAJ5151266.1 hypothetical protein N7482_010518 [Penicillium canariense]